jgi:tetratricopeptide (TPR) repeat protein
MQAQMQRNAEDHYRLGRAALDAADIEGAVLHLQSAYQLDASKPVYRSYYGLAIGLAERRLERAIPLCRSAATDEFFNPVHFLNLAKLHLACGFKAEAIRYLRRGLMIDPGNEAIGAELRSLGIRRRPPLGFLRRRNPLNRLLGKLLRRMPMSPDLELTPFQI